MKKNSKAQNFCEKVIFKQYIKYKIKNGMKTNFWSKYTINELEKHKKVLRRRSDISYSF